MKILNRYFLLVLFFTLINTLTVAQDQTQSGTVFFEAGTSQFGDIGKKNPNTSFILLSSEGSTIYAVGVEGGYFISDNFALKGGLGFTNLDYSSYFAYKIGIKYYLGGQFPVQVDLTGATRPNPGGIETPEPFWMGIQGGYAFYLNDNVSFEPALRYNISMNKDFSESGIFELNLGFVIFL